MQTPRAAAGLLFAMFAFGVLGGGQRAGGQSLHLEVGGGRSFPASSVHMIPAGDSRIRPSVDQDSGPHVYASIGLSWTVSSNLVLGARLRAQQSQLRGNTSDLRCEGCSVSNEPKGRVRTAILEGRMKLISLGRLRPYFLVGLGVVRTTVDGTTVKTQAGTDEGREFRFQDIAVTDAGGDVGIGAQLRLIRGLSATAEIRVTGSLPGSWENTITVFPFTLGLSYSFD